MIPHFKATTNGRRVSLDEIPSTDWASLSRSIVQQVRQGLRISSLFGLPAGDGTLELVTILADDSSAQLLIAKSPIENRTFRSLTTACPEAHLFERELAEQHAAHPEGHPWMKPVRFAAPIEAQNERRPQQAVGVTNFYRVAGDEVHEVAVGPVHAGVIEPGHFRFQCHGENVFHLEISLGYQHRGIEEALIGGPHAATLRQIETIAGDTSVGHAWAHAQCMEALCGTGVSPRAEVVRAIALEFERLANHAGDLGALAGDIGYLPTMSFCGRIRGDFLNMTALLCGNRFGRCLVVPGGVRFDIDVALRAELIERLTRAESDIIGATELLWSSSSVMARFENTGAVNHQSATDLGLVGVAARACGLERDVRFTHPFGLYRYHIVPIALSHQGDVASRAIIRWLEIKRSIRFIRGQLEKLDRIQGAACVSLAETGRDVMVVSMVEGWRGEICHVAITDPKGRFRRYKVCDPSFHNWQGLAMALRGQQISDFPLCNKSFNLSYCGVDL